ncbi:olfactory receptor 52B2-like [Chanos chanos]|uniref:Olfactory receptor n=1 Tax=Chanos chanos TaxID=29144 RepID=A0A6J2VP00_CHACN|nr:olfactory receptor 52B2-like [Chanos chanos]
MNQSTSGITLALTSYETLNQTKNIFFIFIFLVYVASTLANIFLMAIIFLESTLHKPMYIFLFNLACNGLIGSTTVWPKVMDNLLSNTWTITYAGCLVQIFLLGVYATCTFTILTVMAYDRYVFIFMPLQYHNIMTPSKVKHLLVLSNLVPMCTVSGQVCLASKLSLCRYTIHKLFCDNKSLTNLACAKNTLHHINSLYGICIFVAFGIVIIFFVLLSYEKIILVIFRASKDAQRKAFVKCMPHLIVFVNFSLSSLFSIIHNQFPRYVPEQLNAFLSVQFILIPPLLHPIIYGLKTDEIRNSIRRKVFAFSQAVWL